MEYGGIVYWEGTFTSQGQTTAACQSDRSMICDTLQEKSNFFVPMSVLKAQSGTFFSQISQSIKPITPNK